MDPGRFDALVRRFADDRSRRQILKLIAGSALGTVTSLLNQQTAPALPLCRPQCRGCDACQDGSCVNSCNPDQCEVCDIRARTCRSRCNAGACEVCQNGTCASTCGPCEVCANGRCQAQCSSTLCQVCRGGVCVSTCDPKRCGESCVFPGVCKNKCTDPCRPCDPNTGTCSEKVCLHYFALGDSRTAGHGLLDTLPESDGKACRSSGKQCKPEWDDARCQKEGGLCCKPTGNYPDPGWCCRRSPRAYPYKVAAQLQSLYEVTLRNLGCSGATSDHLAGQVREVLDVLDGDTVPADRPVLVSITIGANDFPWSDEEEAKAFFRRSDFHDEVSRRVDIARNKLVTHVNALLDKRPTVRVVITETYSPINRKSIFFPGYASSFTDLLLKTEFVAFSLNQAGDRAVGEINLQRAEEGPRRVAITRGIFEAFDSHRSPTPTCGEAEPGNGGTWIQYRTDTASNSFPWWQLQPDDLLPPGWKPTPWRGDCFHPNEAGHQAFANRVWSAAVDDLGFAGSVAPRIFETKATPFLTKAVVTWRTDVRASSVVDYGTTRVLGQRSEDRRFITEHSVDLADLTPGTTYYYRVTSSNVGGTTRSDVLMFDTSPSCNPGTTLCNGECVAIDSDPAHCGRCANDCAGRSCQSGKCVGCQGVNERCVDSGECCSGVCEAIDIDPVSTVPRGSVCAPSTCPAGQTFCLGACVDPVIFQSDPAHCGRCGRACTGGKTCRNGVCACPTGLSDCDGTCHNLQINEHHCGSCGNDCQGKNCVNGVCVCKKAFTLCRTDEECCSGSCEAGEPPTGRTPRCA